MDGFTEMFEIAAEVGERERKKLPQRNEVLHKTIRDNYSEIPEHRLDWTLAYLLREIEKLEPKLLPKGVDVCYHFPVSSGDLVRSLDRFSEIDPDTKRDVLATLSHNLCLTRPDYASSTEPRCWYHRYQDKEFALVLFRPM